MEDTIRFEQMNTAMFMRGEFDTALMSLELAISVGSYNPKEGK